MENSCEELCLIWGQREQDEVYSTREMIEDYAVHLPASAANVFIGLRFYSGEEEYQHARPTCSRASSLPCVLSPCLGAIPLGNFWRTMCKEPVTASFSASQEDGRNSELWGSLWS